MSFLFFADTSPVQGGGSTQWLIMGLLFAGMWFLMIAPQRKRQKEHQKMLDSLGVGDQIVTSGGIYGTIKQLKKDRLVLSVGETTQLEIGRSFIQAKVS